MSRRKRPSFEKFQKEQDSNKGESRKDERFWVLTRDDQNNGSAVIRFLPNKNEEDLPYKATFKHAIFVNGKNFIDRCPTTIGEECPVCEWNKELNDREFILENGTYRKKTWICNILVINDPKNEDNNGKVFLFEFGKQVYNIIQDAIKPDDDDDEPIWYFDWDEGCNFKVKVKKEGDYPTWTRSKFTNESTVADEIKQFGLKEEDIANQLYDLDEVVTNNAYKPYDALKIKFKDFLDKANLDSTSLKIEKQESDAVKVYSSKKKSAMKKINEKSPIETDDDEMVEKPKPKSKSSDGSIDKVESKVKKLKDAKSYFKQFSDDDDDD